MKKLLSMALLTAAMLSTLTVGAQAADYEFVTDGTPEYYDSTSYEEVYGSQYNYGGPNVVDYQVPELEYGSFSTTQTGIMEKALLPGLQATVATSSGTGGYGISGSGGNTVTLPGIENSGSLIPWGVELPAIPQYTELTDDFLLSNGTDGNGSIPAIGVKNDYLCEEETTSSINKGLACLTSSSVWVCNMGLCGHNREAKYVIGAIKDLVIGYTVT